MFLLNITVPMAIFCFHWDDKESEGMAKWVFSAIFNAPLLVRSSEIFPSPL
jgi:hypothetical protein